MLSKKSQKISLQALAIIAFIIPALLVLCNSTLDEPTCPPCKFSKILMGTTVEITIYGVEQSSADSAIAHVFSEMKRLEAIFSPYDSKGELYAINASAHKNSFTTSPEMCLVLKKSLDVCNLSGHAFDPTFFALGIDFKDGVSTIPSTSELKKRLALVNCKNVKIEPNSCTFKFEKDGMKIGLGGIAKGFIGDKAAEILKIRGIENFIVNAGGDMVTSGSKGDKPWRVGIEDPINPEDTFAIIEPKNCAIATSGNYLRFGEKEGKKWGHIVDPRTGTSADKSLSSTICAKDLMTADAWATALFVLGEEGIATLEKLGGVEGLLVTKDKKIVKTSHFDECAGLVEIK